MRKITIKQMRLLRLLQEFFTTWLPASYRELAIMMNLVSSSTIKGYLDALKKKGLVDWEEGRPRTLHIIEQKKAPLFKAEFF